MVASSQAAAAQASDRRSAPFTFNKREVTLYKPSTGQEYILLTVLNLADESASQDELLRTMRTFGVMLQSLFVESAELDFVMGTLARGGDVEPFIDLARQMAEHWSITEEDEPANREERRAAPRRPAAKATKAPARPGARR